MGVMVLCLLVPMFLHDATGGFSNTRNPWWATAIIAVSGLAYAGVIASARRQLFAMVLWLFTYIFMGMAPYVQYRLEVLPGTTPFVNTDLYPTAGTLALTACLAVLVGNFLAGQSRRPLHALKQSVVDPRRANMLTAAALLMFLYHAAQIGFSSFLLSRTEIAEVRLSVWADSTVATLMTGGMQMALLVGFIAQMTVREQRKAAGLRAKWLPVLVNGAVLLFAVNPVSSPRYVFGTVALAILATLGAYATMTRFRVMAVAAMVGMLTVFPIADVFRHTTEANVEARGVVDSLTTGDFDAFNQLTNAINYVATEGITYGGQLLGVLLLWVPRSVWPNKPTDTGILLAEHMGYDFANLSAPIWAELFINFGWIGMVLGIATLGYFIRRWDTRAHAYLRVYRIPPLLVCSTAFYLVIFLRGSMLAVSANLLVILVASWFVVRKRPARRPTAPRTRTRPHHGPPDPYAQLRARHEAATSSMASTAEHR